ncbi:MAG TPA: hypothetical protein VJ730_04635 [Nitrososphaera sp.]|nr:hypothetical protein [Nitrososphaera sp.]
MSDSIVPVVIGLAVGIGLIATFSVLAFQAEQVGNTPVMKIVWVEKSTTQCDDPWYHEQISVIDFFANRKINVYDMDQAYFLEADHRVCASCDCISGETLYLAIDASNMPEMQKYGFTKSD